MKKWSMCGSGTLTGPASGNTVLTPTPKAMRCVVFVPAQLLDFLDQVEPKPLGQGSRRASTLVVCSPAP